MRERERSHGPTLGVRRGSCVTDLKTVGQPCGSKAFAGTTCRARRMWIVCDGVVIRSRKRSIRSAPSESANRRGMETMTAIAYGLLVLAAVGLFLIGLQVASVLVHFAKRPPAPRSTPGITILKPLCG